jgi:hypothetical protein
MVSTVPVPPTDRIDPPAPVPVRPRPRFRRLVVFTGKLS